METKLTEGAMLAAAAAIAGGTTAYADPVRFDNDGSFTWEFGTYLSLTEPAHAQTGADSGPGSFARILSRTPSDYGGYYEYNRIAASMPSDAVANGYMFLIDRLRAGQVIPDQLYHDLGAPAWRQASKIGRFYMNGAYYASHWYGARSGYMAHRFLLPDGYHYGWIALDIVDGRPRAIEATAWGYETEPGVAIEAGAVPASAPLATLALGALAGMTRRKRA